MGRPKNPTWTVMPFAPDANYPVGALPWSATPTKVAWAGAAGAGFSPKTGVPAQCINYLFNEHANALVQVKSGIDALTTFVGQMPALNFATSLPGGGLRFAMPVINNGQWGWYVGGDACNLRASFDGGFSWGSGNSILADAGVAGGGENCLWGAPDPATGHFVITTNTRYVFQFDGSNITKVDAFSFATAGTIASCCAYDPVHALWCAVLSDDTHLKIVTSPDRTTWSARTVPSGTFSGYPCMAMAVKPSTGRLVFVQLLPGQSGVSAASFYASHSEDGGVTWTSTGQNNCSAGTYAFDRLSLSYNAETDEWRCVVASSTTHKTEVWSSADGLTWTQLASLAATALVGCAPAGNMWVGVTSGGQAAYSLDGGVTWKSAGYTVQVGAAQGAFACSGQVILLSSGRAALGLRTSEPGIGNLT